MNATLTGTNNRNPSLMNVGRFERYKDPIYLTASVVLLVLIFLFIPRLPNSPTSWIWIHILGGGVFCPLLFLKVLNHGYLFIRQLHWPTRKKSEETRFEELFIPEDVKKPLAYDGVAQIDLSQHELLPPIPNAQGKYRARALTIYSAPAIAVLLASLQTTIWSTGFFGSSLILGSALLIIIVYLRIIIDRSPTQAWLELRTRSELLRREQYLCLAQVGPYYPGKLLTPKNRIDQIRIGSKERLNELVLMQYEDDKDHATWLEHLYLTISATPTFEDLLDRVKTYQYYRAGKQIAWMRSAFDDALNTANRLNWLIGTIAIGTVIVAIFTFTSLFSQSLTGTTPTSSTGIVTFYRTATSVGIFLPALSGMVLALQSVFNLRILSENYKSTEIGLERLRKELVELQEEIAEGWINALVNDRYQFELRFKKLVLRVESELTGEYLRWSMITRRDTHDLV
jgi:hypothetical protein